MHGWKLWRQVLWGMVPSVVLIFLVLGTIFMGIATPTEAGALGAVGAVILAALHRRLSWTLVRQAMESTMRLSAMVIFILIGSTVFSLVFQGVDGNVWVEHMLSRPAGRAARLPDRGQPVRLLPRLLPRLLRDRLHHRAAARAGRRQGAAAALPPGAPPESAVIWFGIVLCVNMQTSFMHPPFGFALFYLRGIADQIFKNKTIPRPILSKDIYLGSIPWVVMQLVLVAVVIAWPGSVTYWLDNAEKIDLDKASETLRQMGGRSDARRSDDAARCIGACRGPRSRSDGRDPPPDAAGRRQEEVGGAAGQKKGPDRWQSGPACRPKAARSVRASAAA